MNATAWKVPHGHPSLCAFHKADTIGIGPAPGFACTVAGGKTGQVSTTGTLGGQLMADRKFAIKVKDTPLKNAYEMECAPRFGTPRAYDPDTKEGTKTKRRAFVAQLSLLVLLATAVAVTVGTPAIASNASCGMVVTQDLVLETDLTCSGTGLFVGADGITIDLHGHTLVGDGTGAGIVNDGGFDHVVIKNGVLDGFASGLSLIGASYNHLSRLEVRNSGQVAGFGAGFGIVVQFGDHITISHTIIHDNEQTGILLDTTSDSSLSKNRIFNSQFGSGITLGVNSDNNSIVSNKIFNHTFDAFVAGIVIDGSNNNMLANNNLADNSTGIWVVSGVGNVLESNKATNNGMAGILVLDGTSQTLVVKNKTDSNGFSPSPSFPGVDDGIHATTTGVTLTKNKANRNADYGIEGIDVVDGGKNKAHHNGNPAQCLGVVC
jgi:parallel beta-helix repeat protein